MHVPSSITAVSIMAFTDSPPTIKTMKNCNARVAQKLAICEQKMFDCKHFWDIEIVSRPFIVSPEPGRLGWSSAKIQQGLNLGQTPGPKGLNFPSLGQILAMVRS